MFSRFKITGLKQKSVLLTFMIALVLLMLSTQFAWAFNQSTINTVSPTRNELITIDKTLIKPAIDLISPTWPKNATITASNITASSCTLTWSAATDTVEVKSYNIFKNSVLLQTQNAYKSMITRSSLATPTALNTSCVITGLTAETGYDFSVEAVDSSGNKSSKLSVTVKTLSTTKNKNTPTVFSDIKSGDWYKSYVDNVVNLGIMNGYNDGTFKPIKKVMRSEIAKMFFFAENWSSYYPQFPSFTDVPPTHWAYLYIETAKNKSVMTGYTGGLFHPENNLTRAELSKMICIAENWTVNEPATPSFSDNNPDSWCYAYIETVSAHGIITGFPDGTFKPFNNVNRLEMAIVMSRLSALN